MAVYDRVIRGGTVFDGTRVPRYRADIGIKDGVIAEIGRIAPGDAREVIDADGLHVAPASSTSTPTTMPRSSGTPTAPSRVGTGLPPR